MLVGTQGIISKNFGNNAHPYQVRLTDDEIIFGFYSNTIGWQPVQTYNANLQAGEWVHIACTYNMSQAKIYVNGVQKAVAAKNFEIPQNDQPLEIGRTKDVGYEYFNGTIDEVRVWDVALDVEQISLNMCTNYSGSANPDLIANYKFNECGGTLLTDNQNGNDGVLFGMEGNEWIESDACPSYHVKFIVTEEPGAVPLENATVNMSGTIRYTNINGEADFEGYEPGDYNYSVSKEGYGFETGTFELVDEDLVIDIELLISDVREITGNDFQIFPNPVSGYINVTSNYPGIMQLFDLSGNILNEFEINPGKSGFDVSGYPSGLYFIRFHKKNKIYHFKLIIQ